jgi:UDP-N-acetylmuramate--alanine ligase
VVEADESDRSLLKLDPEIAVLTNAELDHHATYASMLDLEATLAEFMAAPSAVVWDRPALLALCPPGAVAYDAPEPVLGPTARASRWRGIEVVLSVPGAHNAVNAAGALEACAMAGADPAAPPRRWRTSAAPGAGSSGSGRPPRARRLRRLRPPSHRGLGDAGRRAHARTGRLVAVFQPHLYSRTRALASAFGAALAAADVVPCSTSTRHASAPRTSPG